MRRPQILPLLGSLATALSSGRIEPDHTSKCIAGKASRSIHLKRAACPFIPSGLALIHDLPWAMRFHSAIRLPLGRRFANEQSPLPSIRLGERMVYASPCRLFQSEYTGAPTPCHRSPRACCPTSRCRQSAAKKTRRPSVDVVPYQAAIFFARTICVHRIRNSFAHLNRGSATRIRAVLAILVR